MGGGAGTVRCVLYGLRCEGHGLYSIQVSIIYAAQNYLSNNNSYVVQLSTRCQRIAILSGAFAEGGDNVFVVGDDVGLPCNELCYRCWVG